MIYAIILGFISVLQAGLNRKIASHLGVSSATLMNSIVLFLVSLALYIACRVAAQEGTSASPTLSSIPAWYYIPGILGFFLVSGIPYVISKMGALQTLTPLISSQLIASLLWDLTVEGKQPSLLRMAGAAITCIGSALVAV